MKCRPSFLSHLRPRLPLQPLQPVVHVWDSETLLKLQEIGLGAFERGVGALAFSVAVSWPQSLLTPIFVVWEPCSCTSLGSLRSSSLPEPRPASSPEKGTCVHFLCPPNL